MSFTCCRVRWSGRCALVTLPAEVDIANAAAVEADLMAVLRQGAASVVVDLSAAGFCDCSGVNAVVAAFTRARDAGVEFRLVFGGSPARRVFRLTGADRAIRVREPSPAPGQPSSSPGQPPPAPAPARWRPGEPDRPG